MTTTLQVSCKQTRFQVENPSYREIDVEGLNISFFLKPHPGKCGKKGHAHGFNTSEILTDATLRLKPGERYALIGRNGTGKSTLMRAIAEKLIPGMPEAARISILQQTRSENDSRPAANKGTPRTVLEEVIERATAKDELEQEIDGVAETGVGAARALRQLRHKRLQKRLFILDKDARLRSGARGMQARKALLALEKEVATSELALAELNKPGEGVDGTDSIEISDALQSEIQEAADMLAELQIQAEPARVAHTEARAKLILGGLGFTDAMIASSKPVSELSGGWRMRTALATALLSDADILLLDEPTNFLDMLGIVWLQKYLLSLGDVEGSKVDVDGVEARPPPTLILVSHDRDFVSACTDHLILLQPDKQLHYYTGDLDSYEIAEAKSRRHLTKLKDAQDRQRAHMEDTIARNLREGKKNNDDTRIKQAKMRQKKLDDRWGLETNASGHRFKLSRDMAGFHLSKRSEIVVPTEARAMHLTLPQPPELRFPGALISLENVCFRYGEVKRVKPTARTAGGVVVSGGGGPKVLSIAAASSPAQSKSDDRPWTLDNVSLTVNMGDRIGIVGLNGAGKSTLIRLLVGENANGNSDDSGGHGSIQPAKGSVTMHPRLRLAYYAQEAVHNLRALDKNEYGSGPVVTALSLLLKDVREAEGSLNEGELRSLLGELGLPGRLASDTPLRMLSGGQLVRCALARLLWKRPQCLVLDEVTTHLDYETSTALRQALRTWPGAVVLVSHDRWFMRGAIEGDVSDQFDSSDDESDSREEESGPGGRKAVYRLKAGKLTLLEGGVLEFEDQLEKRVNKLLSG